VTGCTSSTTDPCVRRDDTCKDIFCTAVSQGNVDACQNACNMNLGSISVLGNPGFTCWCLWELQTMCLSSNPFTRSTRSHKSIQKRVFLSPDSLYSFLIFFLTNFSQTERASQRQDYLALAWPQRRQKQAKSA
jgi:hypothetical protein